MAYYNNEFVADIASDALAACLSKVTVKAQSKADRPWRKVAAYTRNGYASHTAVQKWEVVDGSTGFPDEAR